MAPLLRTRRWLEPHGGYLGCVEIWDDDKVILYTEHYRRTRASHECHQPRFVRGGIGYRSYRPSCPSGVVTLMELQEEGWSYVRP